MTASREKVLAEIRRALGKGRSQGEGAQGPGLGSTLAREYRLSGDRTPAEVLDLFVERLSDYNATVARATAADLPGAIARALSQRGARRLAVPGDLPGSWLSGMREDGMEVLSDGHPDVLSKGRLASVHGVLTGCALSVAETGTIVLDCGETQGRRALTLLPDYHLCVVLAYQVMELVPQAVAILAGAVKENAAPLTLISGPSATSDIELERVEGVHGPRTLEVILVEDMTRPPVES